MNNGKVRGTQETGRTNVRNIRARNVRIFLKKVIFLSAK